MAHVMVLDDEPSICWAFRNFLGDDGHRVTIASTAEQAIERVAADPPDVIFLDVRLPGMDGLAALERVPGPVPRDAGRRHDRPRHGRDRRRRRPGRGLRLPAQAVRPGPGPHARPPCPRRRGASPGREGHGPTRRTAEEIVGPQRCRCRRSSSRSPWPPPAPSRS